MHSTGGDQRLRAHPGSAAPRRSTAPRGRPSLVSDDSSTGWWFLVPLLSAGVFTSAAVFLAAERLRSRLLLLAGIGYVALAVVLCSLTGAAVGVASRPSAPATTLDVLGLAAWCGLWIGGTSHVLVLQQVARRRVAPEPPQTAAPAAAAPAGASPTGARVAGARVAGVSLATASACASAVPASADDPTLSTLGSGPGSVPVPPPEVAAEWRLARRKEAMAMLESDPGLAAKLRIGRPDLVREYDDGGLVDVNHVPPAVLARELGLEWRVAERVDAERGRRGGFASLAELVACCPTLPAERVRQISDRLIFLPSSL